MSYKKYETKAWDDDDSALEFSTINKKLTKLGASVKDIVHFIENNDCLKEVVIDDRLAIEDEKEEKEIYDALLRNPIWEHLYLAHSSLSLSIGLWIARAFCEVTRLKVLTVSVVSFDDGVPEIVASALRRNRTLEEITVRSSRDAFDELVQAIASSLRFRSSLKILSIAFYALSEVTYGKLAEALELPYSSLEIFEMMDEPDEFLPPQIGASLLNAVATNKTLREVYLGEFNSDTDNVAGTALSRLFRENKILQKLSVRGPYATFDESSGRDNEVCIDVTTFLPSLVANQTLKEFELSAWGIGDGGIRNVCEAVMENDNISRLGLDENNFGAKGLEAIKDLLTHNTTVRQISVAANGIGDDGVSYICEPLEANNTLVSLDICNNNIGVKGIRTVIESVKTNPTITEVLVSGSSVDRAMEDELRYYLELNKGPRRLLAVSPPLPLSLWPRAFEKADNCRKFQIHMPRPPDVLYHLVKAKADLFSGVSVSRKPKRKRRRRY